MFSARAKSTESRFPAKPHQCTFILTCLNSAIPVGHPTALACVCNSVKLNTGFHNMDKCTLGTRLKLALKEFYCDVRQS